MKIKVLSVIFSAAIIFASCSGDKDKQGADSLKGDTTMHDITRPIGENHLEDLLKIKDEAELKSKFTTDRISYDTIWGPEGMYTMGSYIDQGTKDEVQIVWQDSLRRRNVNAAMAKAWYDTASGNYIFNCTWCSERGVHIGTTTDELEKLNGKEFVFSGFGWDYGGGIRDWQGGMLEGRGLRIDLTESESIGKLPEKEYTQILGDQDIKSDHPIVKKVQPKVYRIAVFKPN
jgi:hypothetical protein